MKYKRLGYVQRAIVEELEQEPGGLWLSELIRRLTGREVLHLTNQTIGLVKQAVDRLVRRGILEDWYEGNKHYYKLKEVGENGR